MDKKYCLGLVLQEPFPIGMAATNRILSYVTEIAKNKNVKVYIPLSTEFSPVINNKKPYGIFKGVDFEYANNTTIWPKQSNKILKIFIVIKSIIKLLLRIKKDNPSTLIFYSNTGLKSFSQIILIKLFYSNKLIIEESEFPKFDRKNKNSILKKIIFSAYRMADGMIVMTEKLKKYYESLQVHSILVLPMTVDINRFKNGDLKFNKDNIKYFAYVGGSGGFERDGLLDSVKAFEMFVKKHNNYKFFIIGPLNNSNKKFVRLKNYIANNNLEKYIIFKGKVPSNEIPKFIYNAVGLFITPPNNFSSGGFPTKLGEYLASGRPVITTDIKDITNKLSHENAFIAKARSPEDISSKIEKIANNPKLANLIGENGKKTAEKIFNIKEYQNKLELFLFNRKS